MSIPVNKLTGCVIHQAIKIHKNFGPGLLESVYERRLERALIAHGLRVVHQHQVNFTYNDTRFENAFRVDLRLEEIVVIEIKSLEKHNLNYAKQMLFYLRLMYLPVGLLLNSGMATMKAGTERIVNQLSPSHSPLSTPAREQPAQIDRLIPESKGYRYFSINFCNASLPGHNCSNGRSTSGVVTVFDTACMSLPPSLMYNNPVATSCRI